MSDKHITYFETKKLRDGESIAASIKGYVPSGKKDNSSDALFGGRLVLTNERVCYIRKGIMGEAFETVDLPQVRSIEAKSLLGHRTVKLFSTHNDLTVKSFEKKEAFQGFVADVEAALYRSKSEGLNLQPSAQLSAVEQLEKLASLRDGGILSEDEFNTKKAELLARI